MTGENICAQEPREGSFLSQNWENVNSNLKGTIRPPPLNHINVYLFLRISRLIKLYDILQLWNIDLLILSIHQCVPEPPRSASPRTLMELLHTNEQLMDLIKIKCICRILLRYD